MMSVEMVRRYVQNSADLRAEFVDCLQLETADLCHRNCIITHLHCILCIRQSDISYDKYTVIVCFHDLTRQCCRCRLTIGSCDRNNFSFTTYISKFDLAPNWNACLLHTYHKRQIRRHTRA